MSSRKYQPRRNRIAAAAISAFLGAVGGQRWYLRQNGVGIMMAFALFATNFKLAPIFMIFGLFEAVKFLSMSDQEFDRRYNRYASQNRKGDYLEQRRERQIEKSRSRSGRRRQQPDVSRGAAVKANPFKNSGIKKYKDYDLEGAIEDFTQGININPNDVALHFNIACAYSMTEEKDKAYYHLAKAVELGFKDFEMIKTKDDLAFVRIQPEFDEFQENGYKLGARRRSANSGSASAQQSDDELVITDDVLLSQLNKLAELRNKGLLSSEEFNIERKKLLRR